jgi:hypothetical protein
LNIKKDQDNLTPNQQYRITHNDLEVVALLLNMARYTGEPPRWFVYIKGDDEIYHSTYHRNPHDDLITKQNITSQQ